MKVDGVSEKSSAGNPDSDAESDISAFIDNIEDSYNGEYLKPAFPSISPQVRIGRVDIKDFENKYITRNERPRKRIRLYISSTSSECE